MRATTSENSQSNPSIIYEDSDIRIIQHIADGSDIVVAFSNMLFQPKGVDYWGRTFFEKNGYSAIGVVAKSPNWFPATSMAAAAVQIQSVTGKYDHKIAYGNSMGGYAALKYARIFGADISIAFSPQYSINPQIVGSFENRFLKYFDVHRHLGMEIMPNDLVERSYIFFDPFQTADFRHVELITSNITSKQLFPVPMTGHNTIGVFAGSRSGKLLLESCKANDTQALKKFIAQARRRNPARARYIAERVVHVHPAWADAIAAKAAPTMPANDLARCYHRLAQVHRDCGRISEMTSAARNILSAVKSLSLEEWTSLRLNNYLHSAAGFLSFGGFLYEAEAAECLAVAGDPENTAFLRRLLWLKLSLKKIDESREIAAYILHLSPEMQKVLIDELGSKLPPSIRELIIYWPKVSIEKNGIVKPGPWVTRLIEEVKANASAVTRIPRQVIKAVNVGGSVVLDTENAGCRSEDGKFDHDALIAHLDLQNDVLLCPDGELVLASTKRRTLDYALGIIEPSTKSIDNFKRNIASRKDYCKKLGINYVHLVVPDKHVVYKDSLPFRNPISLATFFRDHGSISFVYPDEHFRSFLPQRVYKHTDTHWTPLGNAIACARVAEELGLPKDRIEIGWRSLLAGLGPEQKKISGNLGSKLLPQIHENIPVFKKEWTVERYDNGLPTGNAGIIEILLSEHQNAAGRLIVFGDSYFRESLDMLSVFFKEILFCSTRFFHKEIVRSARPDYVVTENIERYLSAVADDDDAPPCLMVASVIGQAPVYSQEMALALSYFLSENGEPFLARLKKAKVRASLVPGDSDQHDREKRESVIGEQLKQALSSENVNDISLLLASVGIDNIRSVELRSIVIRTLAKLGRRHEASMCILQLSGAMSGPELTHLRSLARDLAASKIFDMAAAVWRFVIEQEGTNDDYFRLGQVYAKLNELGAAVDILAVAIEKGNRSASCYATYGTALSSLKRFEEAVEAFRIALALEPDRADTHRECGRALRFMGRSEQAIPYFERVRTLRPDLVRSYLELGRALAAIGRNEQARDIFQQGVEVVSDDPQLLMELARTEARFGNRLVAMDLFQRVQLIEPGNLKAGVEFVRQALTMRKFDVAKPAAEALLAHHPDNPDVLFEFGRMSLEIASPEQAREALEKALAIRPDFHQCHYRLAQLALRTRNIEEAAEHFSQAIALEPNRVSYRIDRARVFLALDQLGRAGEDARHALSIEAGNLKASQILSLVRSFSDDQPEPSVAAALVCSSVEVAALLAARARVAEPHMAFVVAEGAPERVGVLSVNPTEALTALLSATDAPWLLKVGADTRAAALDLLAEDGWLSTALKGVGAMYGRVLIADQSGRTRAVLYRRELLQFMQDASSIEERPLSALLSEYAERLRTVRIDAAGKLTRLPGRSAGPAGGEVFLISRHGIELFGGGEQFLRGMGKVYRGLGYEPIIIGMRNDVPGVVYGEQDGERFANIRPLPGDIFSLALLHKPAVVQVLSGLGYEVITPLKFLHVYTVYGTHYWRDMFEEIGGYLDIDRHAVPRREFTDIIRDTNVIYSNSHFTEDMKRKYFGLSTPIVYSLTNDVAAPPSPAGTYALLVNARPEKGFDLILEVAKRAPKVQFLVIASQSPVAQAEEAVARAGVSNIQVVGRTSDMESMYRGARVVLVPSYSFIETFSRVVIEAHRLGVPIVGSDRGNVPFLLTESGTALPEDPDLWAEELTRLFTDDAYHATRRRMALENSERYAFVRQPDRIGRILRFCAKRILVGVGAGLGNIIQATPLLRRIAEHYGRPVDVVVKEDFKNCSILAACEPWVNMTFPLDRNIVQREYDLVYLTHSFGDLIPAFNANEIVAARQHYPFEMTKDIHESEFNLFCARQLLGISYGEGDARKYFVSSASRSEMPNGMIALHSGGKGGEWETGSWLNKRWPYYRDLVGELARRGFAVASFGVADEYVPGTIDMTGTPLAQTIRNLSRCSYFIGNDSGVMHIADGLGIPLTAVFGPTSVVKNGPLAPTSSVIELKKSCAPCQFDERFATCTCISEISVDQLLEHMLRHMEETGVTRALRQRVDDAQQLECALNEVESVI